MQHLAIISANLHDCTGPPAHVLKDVAHSEPDATADFEDSFASQSCSPLNLSSGVEGGGRRVHYSTNAQQPQPPPLHTPPVAF